MLLKQKYPHLNRKQRQSFIEVDGEPVRRVKTNRSRPLRRHGAVAMRRHYSGLLKIEALIKRGIQLNSKPVFMKRVAQNVKQAILG